MSKYKVCHMTSAHKSDDVRIFYKECTSLASRDDLDVYLVARGDSREENAVHVIGVGEPPSGRISRMTGFAKKVAEVAESLDADIYHFHDPELLPYGASLSNKGYKVIFDSHENTYEQILIKPYIPAPLRHFVASAYKKRENRWVGNMAGAIYPAAGSPFEGVCQRNVRVDNTPRLDELYDHYDPNIEKEDRTVCYVGSLTHERGITHLIKACHKANVRLILAGNFSSEDYHKELMDDEAYTCVDYRGFADREQVLNIYKESIIGISTLLNVGQYVNLKNLPTKVYEYMSMGLPVVLSDIPYAKKVNEECGFAILVEPDNVDQIASAISELLDNPDKAKQLGENARNAIKDKFNWSIDEARLYKLYDEILMEIRQ